VTTTTPTPFPSAAPCACAISPTPEAIARDRRAVDIYQLKVDFNWKINRQAIQAAR
jgi:hypothetical protein